MLQRYAAVFLCLALCCPTLTGTANAAEFALENPQPNAIESGISAITGWYCPAAAITVQVDSAAPFAVPYGSERLDTASRCGGATKTGFAYLFNYNTLATGTHTIKGFADGIQFASASISVVTLGAEFLTGKAGEYILNNFPDYGKRTRVTWQQSKQNFIVSGTDTQVAPIDGVYIGTILSNYTGCTTAGNNGNGVFDFYKYTLTYGAQSLLTVKAENSNAVCTFAGTAFYTSSGGDIVVPAGDFSCANGFKGTWTSDRMVFDSIGLLGNLTLKYTTGETCTAASHISAAR